MYQTSGFVDERTYKAWKASEEPHPSSWCMSCSGPNVIHVDEEDYKPGTYPKGTSVMIFCSFSFDIDNMADPEKYKARRRYFGKPQ